MTTRWESTIVKKPGGQVSPDLAAEGETFVKAEAEVAAAEALTAGEVEGGPVRTLDPMGTTTNSRKVLVQMRRACPTQKSTR